MTTEQEKVYLLGYQDRVDTLPDEFTSGRTFPHADLNEAYDRGVNQAERDYRAGVFTIERNAGV